ncbi:MAG: hypothetical protein HYX73_09570 [Acidobacteria bacterium]|nr:hypothetical protein [Acidobacteriota bacterium]
MWLGTITLLFILTASKASPLQNIISEYNVPDVIRKCVETLGNGYLISGKINPFYLSVDYDGDGNADFAVLIKRGEQQGIAICPTGRASPTILGAGTEFHQMRDLDFDAWQLHPKNRRVERGADESPPPRLQGDAIHVVWEERASAILYWNGRSFAWYQQGD